MKVNNFNAVPKKKYKLKNWVKYFGFFVMGILVTIITINLFNKRDGIETIDCSIEQKVYIFEKREFNYDKWRNRFN